MLKIRASSLSHYVDCPRRAAARMFPSLLEDYGISLPALPPSIGAAVGTATHKAVEEALTLGVSYGKIIERAVKESIRGLCPLMPLKQY